MYDVGMYKATELEGELSVERGKRGLGKLGKRKWAERLYYKLVSLVPRLFIALYSRKAWVLRLAHLLLNQPSLRTVRSGTCA